MDTEQKTTALIVSGGGSRIAAQLSCIEKICSEEKLDPDIIGGVSAGGLFGAFLAMYPKGRIKQALLDFKQLLLSLNGNKSIWSIPWSFLFSWIVRGGFFSSSPLKSLITREIDHQEILKSGRTLYIGAYNFSRNLYQEIDKTNPHLKDYLLASASIPLVFPCVNIPTALDMSEQFADGGITDILPVHCVLKHRPSEIHAVLSSPPVQKISSQPQQIKGFFSVLLAILKGTYREVLENDLTPLLFYKKMFPQTKVFIYYPETDLKISTLNFKERAIKKLFKLGFYFRKTPIEDLIEHELYSWLKEDPPHENINVTDEI